MKTFFWKSIFSIILTWFLVVWFIYAAGNFDQYKTNWQKTKLTTTFWDGLINELKTTTAWVNNLGTDITYIKNKLNSIETKLNWIETKIDWINCSSSSTNTTNSVWYRASVWSRQWSSMICSAPGECPNEWTTAKTNNSACSPKWATYEYMPTRYTIYKQECK